MVLESELESTHRVGRYRLIAGVGRGGMADVYLAVNAGGDAARFQKLLVLKLLKPELASEHEFVEMFMDEARLAARLNHPNVVQTLEVGEDQGRYFIAMEYLEGQPLNRVMTKLDLNSSFDLSARLTVLLRALTGLDYAHELSDYDGTPLNVVHRDVSPGNILVGYDGQVKLMDFGIAKANDSSNETRIGMFKGKTAYMAPEQARAGSVDRTADIYSAGVVLWELLVGRRMWQGVASSEILSRVVAGEIPKPSSVVSDVAPELERICMTALALNKQERYASAAAFAEELETYLKRRLVQKSDREVGRSVAEAFNADRARMRDTIERQLSTRPRAAEILPQIPALSEQTQSSVPDASSVLATSSATQPNLDGRRRWLRVGMGLLALGVAIGVGMGLKARTAPPSAALKPKALAPAARFAEQPAQQGVSPTEITLGMSAVFSGPSRELGENMKLGVETAFSVANAEGGVHGRKLRLVALDDGYEAARVNGTMLDLLDQRKVFALLGNVGTPTSAVAAPIASQHKTIFFGAFTGAPLLRQDPPDRYVFNYRASYREETATALKYLVDVQKIPLDQIIVFAQEDSFGDAGFEGVSKAVRQLDRAAKEVLRVGYKRNTADIDAALVQALKYNDRSELVHKSQQADVRVLKHPIKAVVMIATYRAAAKFIQKMREVPRLGKPLFMNVSFVGTEALAEDLKNVDPGLCQRVYVTQVVPPYNSGATAVRRFRDALANYQPQAQPGFVSLEGYIVGSLFIEGVRRVGPVLTSERLVDAFEQLASVDLGFGVPLTFSPSEHQASHKVWGTRLDEACVAQPVDLE